MIVVYSHAHPSVSKGGAEGSAYALYRGLLELGHEAAFVACVPEKEISGLIFETPQEYVVPFRPENYDIYSHCTTPGMYEALKEITDSLKPTTLIFHHFLHVGINAIRGLVDAYACPTALVLHEFLAICHNDGQMVKKSSGQLCTEGKPSACHTCFPTLPFEHFHVRRKLFLQVMSKLTAVVSPSQFLADKFTQWGVPREKIEVIENGVLPKRLMLQNDKVPKPVISTEPEPNVPDPTDAHFEEDSSIALPAEIIQAQRIQPGKLSRSIVFGYFGRISRYKGVELLLDAADQLAQDGITNVSVRVHGNIAGAEASLKERLENFQPAGALVQYYGPYENADVLHLMQKCDFVVMTSQWWENSPLVIQEAYAAHRPMLVPNVGGMAEKVKDGINGLHYEFANVSDLAMTMVRATAEQRLFTFPPPPTAAQMAQSYWTAIQSRISLQPQTLG
jgi:glycosyltransferase involved in cell wall biosynthesis